MAWMNLGSTDPLECLKKNGNQAQLYHKKILKKATGLKQAKASKQLEQRKTNRQLDKQDKTVDSSKNKTNQIDRTPKHRTQR